MDKRSESHLLIFLIQGYKIKHLVILNAFDPFLSKMFILKLT